MSSRREQAARRRKKKQGTGSSNIDEPDFLLVGRLRRPHGVKGEMLASIMTDFPERIKTGATLLVGPNYRPLTVAGIRHHSKGALILFEEFENREQMQGLRNQGLYVRADDRPPLPEGEYYQHQLIGLQVISDEGQLLGVLAEFIETGANDVLVVRPEEGKDILLPDIKDVVVGIDLDAKQITVHVLDGLLE